MFLQVTAECLLARVKSKLNVNGNVLEGGSQIIDRYLLLLIMLIIMNNDQLIINLLINNCYFLVAEY